MYLRFTTQFINPYDKVETGIFMALKFLRDDHLATKDDDVKKLKQLSLWFNKNLNKPTRFSNASNKNPANISLSWFKDSAKEHIQKVHDLVAILEEYDFVVERFASKNPGYIVFEDEFQISAIPYKSNRNKVI